MEELVHGELKKSLIELQEGKHNGEVDVFGVVHCKHVRQQPRHGLSNNLVIPSIVQFQRFEGTEGTKGTKGTRGGEIRTGNESGQECK